MANISTENINTLAQIASSLGDGDYIYIFKAGAKAFSRIEKSLFMQEMSGGGSDISDILSNDWNDSSRKHVPSARQMNLMYNNLISVYNSLTSVLSALANSSFKTARPEIAELDWVGDTSSYTIGYNLTHCQKTSSSPTSVAEGDSFTATIVPDAGYTLNGVQATGMGFTQVYDSENDRININASNVQNGLTIGCVAATFQVGISYNLVGFASENNTTMQSGGSFTKVLSPNKGYSVRNIVITMGGVALDNSQAWDSSTNTISIPVVTGDITITATAEETTDHTINYDKLVQVNKVSGATSVVDGGTLSVELEQASGFNGIFTNVGSTQKGLHVRDILVYMDDILLVQGVDYTAVQESLGSNITLTISNVTGNVLIMNVYFVVGIINHNNGNNATSVYSLRTDNYIPIPKNCQGISVHHLYASSGNQGVVVYSDELGTRTTGAQYKPNEDAEITWESSAQSSYKYVRFCLYGGYNTHDPNKGFILNKTNSNYIWHGTNVTNE